MLVLTLSLVVNAPPAFATGTTVTFSSTGSAQSWTVPSGVSSIQVDVQGAQGYGPYSGLGSRVVATLSVTTGEVLNIYVGNNGYLWGGGYNGGGSTSGTGSGRGGGGASDIRVGGTALSNRIIVAGGGGGSGNAASTDAAIGGSAGGPTAQAGDAGTCGTSYATGGGGGTASAGGAAGTSIGSSGAATAGSLGTGGTGDGAAGAGGGGGGGGYYGGGGGGECNSGSPQVGGAGGGGSDYVTSSATNVEDFQGWVHASGQIIITYPPPSAPSAAPPGIAAFFNTNAIQTWTVPAGVTSAEVAVTGGGGGAGNGGAGGQVVATISVTPGQKLEIVVGGPGTKNPGGGGYNGGGGAYYYAGGGGGASDIRVNGLRLEDRLIVAGGGGGESVGAGPTAGNGGSGGGVTANSGGSSSCTPTNAAGGGGGSSTAGGTAGDSGAGAGSLGAGGYGDAGGYWSGGGGGGGYYGGGGGATCSTGLSGGGGGGGSDYEASSVTNVQDIPGVNGHGKPGSVLIAYPDFQAVGPALSKYEEMAANPSENSCSACAGDPVNTATGNLTENFTDFSIPGRGPGLAFSRTYNSLTASTEGPLGYGWTDSYAMSLAFGSGSPPSTVTVNQENGTQVTFTYSGSTYTAPGRVLATLVQSGSNWIFTRKGAETFTFNSSGQLTAETDLNGYTTSLTYSSGKLSTVTDPASRTFVISYGTNGLISEVTDPDSRHVMYGYDGSGNLTSVTDPNTDVTSFTYDSNHLMLTVTAPNGQSGKPDAGDKTVNTYDTSNRVLTQTDPAGLETTFSYSSTSNTNNATTITDPHGDVTLDVYIDSWLIVTKGVGSAVTATWAYGYDPGTLGLVAKSDPDGNISTATFYSNGLPQSTTDADANTTSYTYNSFDEPLTVTDPRGIVTTYTYNSDGDVLTKVVTGVLGSPTETTTYTYGDGYAGDLTQVQDPDGHVTTYTYDVYGDRTSTATYPSSAVTTSPTSSADHFASTATITAVGTLTSNDALALSTLADDPQTVGDVLEVFAQSGTPSLTVTSISGGGVSTWTKEAQFAGSFGGDTEIWYGNVTTAGSSTITFSWSGSIASHYEEYGVQEFTAGLGANTVWTVDKTGSGNGSSSTSVPFPSLTPSGSSELYFAYAGVYNTATGGTTSGFTFTVTAEGNLTTYDTNVSSAASPIGTQTPAGVSSAVAALLTASSSTGPTVTGVSPSSGSSAGGTSVSITGTNFTGATAVTFGSIPAASFTVNSASSITATDPTGLVPEVVDITVAAKAVDVTTDAYNIIGQRYCEVSPDANAAGVTCPAFGGSRVADTSTWSFDGDGNIQNTTDADGNETTYAYDANNNQTTVTDPLTNVTLTAYDADNRVTSVTSGNGSSSQTTTTYAYDIALGTCVSPPARTRYCTTVKNGLGSSYVTTNYYNALDQIIDQAAPNTTAQTPTAYTYDGVGNVLTKSDGSGTATYAYNGDNQVTGITYSSTASGYTQPHVVTYQYDLDGNRSQMVDGTGTTTYSYDSLERLDSVSDGATNVVTYGYDADNNVTCLSYPNSGSTNCQNASSGTGIVAYTYDGAGEETSMTDWLGSGNVTSFAYDADGNLIQTTLPSGTTTSVTGTYDNADALTDTSYKVGSSTTNLASLGRNVDELIGSTTPASGGATTYGYDALNRVTTGTSTTASVNNTYSYDLDSELTSVTPTGGSTTDLGYNTDGQMCFTGTATGTCLSPPTGATVYSYSTTGQRLSTTPSGLHPATYGWDQAGNLVCETAPNSSSYSCSSPNSSVTTTYAYNGDGLRMSDTPAGGSIQQFTWDVSGSVPQLLEDGTNYYLYGPSIGSAPLEQIAISGSTPSYLISDTTGVREQVSSTGSLTGPMTYDSYGNRCSSCSISTSFGFEGGYTDATGLVYLVHRYYDPATEQFLSVDPAVSLTGQPYEYAGDNPTNVVDPLGLWGWNPFSDVAQAWNDTGGKVVHAVATHTIGLCLNVGGGAGPGGVASGCVALVGGHFTLIGIAGGGGSSPSASATLGLLFSNATHPTELRGPFGMGGGSVDLGVSAGDETSGGLSKCNKTIWENQPSIGVGLDLPIPFEFHGGVTNTWTWTP
jgi:RHS repeat-associated protein